MAEARSFVRKGDEAELDAIGKIYYQRDLLLKQAAKVKATEAEIAASASRPTSRRARC